MGVRAQMNASNLAKIGAGFGKQEGIALVTGARVIAMQHQKSAENGGALTTPYLALQFDEIYVDENHKPINADEPAVQHDVIICWGDKQTLELVSRFQPANVKTPEDPEPVDVGCSDIEGNSKFKLVEIGSEGNCIVSPDGAVPFDNSDFGVFISQIEKKGFKSEITGRGYAPDYVGLVYEFKTSLKSEMFKKIGLNYTPNKDPRKDKKGNVLPDTCREITNVLVRPYEINTAKARGVVAGKAPAAAKAAGSPPAAPKAETNGHGNQAAIDAAVTAFIEANKGNEYANVGKFVAALGTGGLIKAIGMKPCNDYTAGLKKLSGDELGAMGMEFGFSVDEGGKITVDA